MDGIRSFHFRGAWSSGFYSRRIAGGCKNGVFGGLIHHKPSFSFSFRPNPFRYMSKRHYICSIREKDSDLELILKHPIVKQVPVDDIEEEDAFLHDLEDVEELAGDDDNDDFLADEYLEVEPIVGDGSGGGGVSLAGTSWDQTALRIAEEAARSFDGELGIYAFKTLLNGIIQVRIEKLTNKQQTTLRCILELLRNMKKEDKEKDLIVYSERVTTIYIGERNPETPRVGLITKIISHTFEESNRNNRSGSPSLMEVEAFSSVYMKRLDEAEIAGSIPGNLSMEVSSPGVERVVRIPQDLGRFKDRPLFVKYYNSKVSECDGVFRLISFDMETRTCTWGLADVRVNREKAGKGRPLSKKQREWRLETTFDSLLLVRLYSEI